MKLYSNPVSPNCRKVHALIAHLGLDVPRQTIDLRKGEQKEPEYLALNPNGKVPVLVDGDLKLWESNAILGYLAAQADTPVWPKSNERYNIMRWMNWEAAHWQQAVGRLIGEKIFKKEADPAVVERALVDFRKLAAVANHELEAKKFIAGAELTIADFATSVWLGYGPVCGLPIAEFKHVDRWWRALNELPAWSHIQPPTA